MTPPILRLGGEEFECVPRVSHWQLMKLAAAMKGGDLDALGGMYDFMQKIVVPSDWQALDDHLSAQVEFDYDDLESAIGDVLVEMAGRGKDSAESSGPSSAGAPTPPTPPSSRVVSLSRGTVEEVPLGAPRSDEPTSSTG
jgi:hypothetical protein